MAPCHSYYPPDTISTSLLPKKKPLLTLVYCTFSSFFFLGNITFIQGLLSSLCNFVLPRYARPLLSFLFGATLFDSIIICYEISLIIFNIVFFSGYPSFRQRDVSQTIGAFRGSGIRLLVALSIPQ